MRRRYGPPSITLTSVRKPELSYANVISSLALFVALGGTSYGLARNSVGNRELKRDAVTSAKVKDASLTAADISPRTQLGFRGPRGPQGPSGLQGPPGPTIAAAPEPWQPLPFDPRWANYGAGFELAGYRKDQLGRVHLRGLITRVDGLPGNEVIATLPPGYRPAMTLIFTGESQNGVARLDLQSTGALVYISSPAQIERDNTSLSSISYWPD